MSDPRVTARRDGLASRRLEGVEPAQTYVDPTPLVCAVPAAAIRATADPDGEQLDQLLFGEVFEALGEAKDGFLWGQAPRDGYVGFVDASAVGPAGPAPTHRIAALRTYAFAEPSIKTRAIGPFSLNALVRVEAEEGRFRKLAGSGWTVAEHLAPLGMFEADWAAVAERFVGAPYLWGGRESLGLDCSGLVQQALFACGLACPRDTDQQHALGAAIDREAFGRGDLVFWQGHVAMGVGDGRIVHANAHHMATVIEPLDEAIERIAAAGVGEPTAWRRL